MRLGELIALLDGEFPFSLALSWDNSGLQVGDIEQEIKAVAVALDPSPEVVDRAIAFGANCIVTHHPLIFKPLKGVTTASFVGSTVMRLVKEGVSLVSLHTNLDVAPKGLADCVAGLLGLRVEGPLCVEEGRELGRVGTTISPVDFTGFLGIVKGALKGPRIKVVNPPDLTEKMFWKVALCPGSGGDLVREAAGTGAQIYLTGDLKYHQALEAISLGITVVDAGHHGTEMPAVGLLADTVKRLVRDKVPVVRIETEDPFREDLS